MFVALGVTGGIAAYKACEIVRGLTRAGAEVQVILTPGGSRFITPLTLQTLSGNPVLRDQFELRDDGQTDDRPVRHIELTRRISVFAVAPATANVLAKFARGIADDFLTTFHLAVTAPVVMAPAMNTRMWNHPATQENLGILQDRGVRMVGPGTGWLAEREEGVGRMAEPEEIVQEILTAGAISTALAGKKIVVTAGPTREPVDPVRYLSNRSSGKMGFALADAAVRRGAEVTLVSGPVALPTPPGVCRIDVDTSHQMRKAVLDSRAGCDAIIMAAAVADYLPQASRTKIKKTGSSLTLELDEGPDILKELGESRGQELLIGFAAETDDLLENARSKLQKKNLDYIVANDVAAEGIGIDAVENEVTILDRQGGSCHLPRDHKSRIAAAILDHVFMDRPE
jgi:phosphopantothenoylcysteine decarboxylase/phosphopantothenate--cysteine ligase